MLGERVFSFDGLAQSSDYAVSPSVFVCDCTGPLPPDRLSFSRETLDDGFDRNLLLCSADLLRVGWVCLASTHLGSENFGESTAV